MNKPLLGLDVDGVLNAFSEPHLLPDYTEYFAGGYWVLMNLGEHPQWIAELEEHFEIVWATMWTHKANEFIAPILGVGPYPVIDHHNIPDGVEWSDIATIDAMKVVTIDPYIGDRAFAWLDDDISIDAKTWADGRNGPTKLIAPDPLIGFERNHVDELINWAKSL
jgi:hypothetical protein